MNLADVLLERETGSGAVLRDGIVAGVAPLTIVVPPSTVASPATALNSASVAVGDFVQVLVQGANRLVLGATSGRVGVVSYTRKTSDQATITAIVAVLSPSAVTHAAGRRYRFKIELLFSQTVTTDLFEIYLRNVGDGLTYKRWLGDVGGGTFGTFVGEFVTESSISGSQTWRVDVARTTGSGSITVYGFANTTPHATPGSAPRYSSLLIEDIGPL